MSHIIVDTRTDRRRDGFAAHETRESAERELDAARRTLPAHWELSCCAVREARAEDYGAPGNTATAFRVMVTSEPSPATIDATRALLAAAGCTAAHELVARGEITLAEYAARAQAIGERLVATLADGTPTDETTARMIVAAVRIAGGTATVVPYVRR